MSLNSTAELRPNSHKFALKPALMPLTLSNRRLGKPKAADDSPSSLPHAFNSRILAIESAPNGECPFGLLQGALVDGMKTKVIQK